AHEEDATGFARVELADVVLAKGEPAAARGRRGALMGPAPAGVGLVAAPAQEAAATGFARVDLADVLLAKGEPAAARALLDEFMATAPAGVPLLAARAVTVTVRQAEGDHAGARALRAELRAEFAAAGFGWHRYADRLSGPEPPS
uniref:hypothetical protein n=1 Tax=Nocardia brasiliensis TaxID=37326 RepID=UPI00245688FB